MPGKIKVKVLAGRNLPVMDRASDTTDAFVEIKFGNVTHKTDVCRKTLNPHWNSTEWYRFEVDESELQDEPLQLRLMDHDTYSANDAIGKVVISLAPLLAREANNAKGAGPPGAVLSGWIPVFDTMHGIRGELNVIVKVELFSDFNKYKTSSCGVQFFHCASIPAGYKATSIHGFVEELVVNDDPEYQWIDKIRTPRASNEARQVAFIKLSNQVQRLVGLKAAELGANAVVGYQQDFDLEGEAGVVARAIGTAVSLIPPPTPMHSINIPPCTQQQLKKYLDILATDDETVVDLNQYFRHHQHELQRLLNIMNPKTPTLLDDPENIEDDDKYDFTKQSNVKNFTGWYQEEDVSQKSLKHISEDQTDLNKLLRGNEDSDSDSTGPLKKIKKLKTNLTKRLGSLRSRKTDKQDDNVSLQSNSSDNSRISLTELRNEFKKFKRLKKPKFRKSFTNNEDEGIGMASILARSVIHVHTSLACIAEKSEHSPSSTMRRTSESEPTINISDDEHKLNKNDENNSQTQPKANIPETHTSLKNVNVEEANITTRQRKLSESCPASPMAERSENFLKLPDETGYFGSVSLSGDSSEAYTSSEEDGDDSSDPNADVEKSVETTSSVVQSVLNKNVDPAFIAHMERKLSLLEGALPELKESKSHGVFENVSELETEPNFETSKSSPCIHQDENKDEENIGEDNQDSKLSVEATTSSSNNTKTSTTAKPKNNRHFKFHDLFSHKKVSKSMSAPSSPIENTSFIYRSSKRIKRQFSKISKSNLFKSISHYSLNSNKKKQSIKAPLSQPGSSSNVPSKVPSYETVLGSPFLSYADLMSLDKNESEVRKNSFPVCDEPSHSKVKMYIGSEPVSRASLSGPSSPYYKDEHFTHDQKLRKENVNRRPSGLVHTAMETILIDKVQSLLLPACSEVTPVIQSKEQRFFDDVNEKLEKVEESRNQLRKYNFDQRFDTIDSRDTISMSTINSKNLSLPATPCVSHGIENKFFDDHHDNLRRARFKERKEKHDSLMQTAMKTMLIDKVQSLIPATSEQLRISQTNDLEDTIEAHESTHNKHHNTKPSLMHTAMETILIDKVKALLPPSAEPVDTDEENISMRHNESEIIKEKNEKSPSLFHSALETILLDKAQVLIPPGSQPVTPDCSSINSVDSNIPHIPVYEGKVKGEDHCSLLQSAMETILMDKVQSLMPSDVETVSCGGSILSYTPENIENPNDESNLFNTAIKTILIEPISCEVPIMSNIVSNVSERSQDNEKHKSSLFHSALETILMDKVQTLTTVSDQVMESKPASENIVQKSENPENAEKNYESNLNAQPTLGIFSMDNGNSISHASSPRIYVDILKDNETSDDRGCTSYKHNTNETKINCNTSPGNNKADHDSYSTDTKILNAYDTRDKILVRQGSVHSLRDDDTVLLKMSKETSANMTVSPRIAQSKPVLQHFHPILSGKPLETIPSLPESSFDHTESLDIDGVEQAYDNQTDRQSKQCDSETNSASVCGNSHAACDVDRNEREKEKVFEKEKESPRHARHESYGGREPVVTSQSTQNSSFTPSTPLGIHRRSSDSDLSVTPKGGSLNASLGNTGSGGGAILRPSMNSSNIEMLEYPFLTMTEYPPGLIVHLGGTVCARSVKLVDAGGESAARAAWWAELRTELRAHARALRCNAVIAYTESAAICEDVCVLSASGTAAVINLDCDFGNELEAATSLVSNGCKGEEGPDAEQCTLAHVPYSPGAGPYRAELSTCGACRKSRVPAVLLATCAKPNRLPSYTKAVTVTAVAARIRRAQPSAEPGARDISDQLPFLEYELHKLLLAKLRMQGANALFSLRTQIAIGERCVMALASGTAVRLVSLPPPTPPRIKASETDKNALDIQRALWDSFTANKAANGYDIGGSADTILPNVALTELEAEEGPALDLCADKDACVLELDEAEDVETAKTLATRRSHMPVFTNTMKPAKGAPPQMFAQVWRGRLVLSSQGGGASTAAERHVARALEGVAYKLRRLQPCALAAPAFQLELPEDEIQLIVSGSAISLVDPNKPEPESNYNHSNHSSPQQSYHSNYHHGHNGNSDNEDDIFALDEEQLVKTPPPPVENADDKSLVINGQVPTTVSLTTLGFVSGSRSERRVCALRLLFVRETTAVRELGGLSGFLHTFTCEVLAIVRAYTAALGGNALTSFYITQLMLQDNAHKNQGQCLLSVGGDVVHITY